MKQSIVEKAKKLRAKMTIQEHKVWKILRNKKLLGFKFRRQHPIGLNFIVDFCCPKLKLIIEVDGPYHTEEIIRKLDLLREKDLIQMGYRIKRFTNNEVDQNIDRVLDKIVESIKEIKYPANQRLHMFPKSNAEIQKLNE